jgi:proteasome accessory factor C
LRYTPGAEDAVVRIRLAPEASWVADYYPVTLIANGVGGAEVEFSASDPVVAARLLLRLGRSAELLEGGDAAAVRAELAGLRERILARYG